jgi:hypothetical protein
MGATFLAAALAAWFQPPPLPRLVLALVFATFVFTFFSIGVDIRRHQRDTAA